ncbi:conserved hypothetical protein, membrane [Candidatus Magnetomorum sp. HK-1]|nr:conserved hypothetical protein, membrane [Candidatus Magnetomorum sp. HK-1]
MNRKRSSTASDNQSALTYKPNLIILICLCAPLNTTFVFYPWLTDSVLILLDLWIFIIFGFWIISQFFFSTKDHVTLIKTYIHYFIVFIFFLLLIYCFPIPADVLKILSPKLWSDTQWIIMQAPWIFEMSQGWGHLSYNFYRSLFFSIHGIACCMLFLLFVHTIKTQLQLSFIIYSLIVALTTGTLAACLFFYDWTHSTNFTPVHHHMTIILHVIIPMCLALITTHYRKTKKPVFKTIFYSIKITFKNLIGGQHANLMKITLILILIFSFILLSNDFGLRLISLSLSILLGGLLLSNKKKMRSLVIVWGLVGSGIAVYALISEPITSPRSMDSLMTSIAKDYPITGVGLGALPAICSRYSNIEFHSEIFYDNHYSAWLRLLIEIGFLGVGLCLTTFLMFIFRMYTMWIKRQNSYSSGWALGIMVSLASIGLFGIGYGFGNSYIVLPLISTLAACGFLVLHAGHQSARQPFFYRTILIQRKSWQMLLFSVLFLICFIIFITQLFSIKNTEQKTFELSNIQVETECIRKLKKNMFQANLWHDLAKLYRKYDKDTLNQIKIYLPRADICYETACYLAPQNINIIFDAAKYWIWRSQTFKKSENSTDLSNQDIIPKTQEAGIRLFQKKFKKILDQEPKKLKLIVDAIWEWYKSDIIVLDSLPEKSKQLKQTALEYVLLHKK